MAKKPFNKLRGSNAILALVLVVFFFLHSALGSLEAGTSWQGALAWVVWIGVGAIAIHFVLCIATSRDMLTDEVRPPSKKKKQHLALKWVSGGILVIVAVLHVTVGHLSQPWALVLLAMIAWHAYIGGKSLARDLNMPRGAKAPLRIAIIVLACLLAVFTLVIW